MGFDHIQIFRGLQILASPWSLILLFSGLGLGIFAVNLKSGVELGF